jgi:hypothetical protein
MHFKQIKNKKAIVAGNKKAISNCYKLMAFYQCPGTDLNRYGHCWPQDFKSCVSTNSTTRALKKFHPGGWNAERKTGLEPATPTLARLCSTK